MERSDCRINFSLIVGSLIACYIVVLLSSRNNSYTSTISTISKEQYSETNKEFPDRSKSSLVCNCKCEDFCAKVQDKKEPQGAKNASLSSLKALSDKKGKNKKVAKLTLRGAFLQVQEFTKKYKINQFSHNGETQYIFILTTWRSGSSFFGEALSSHPAIYYHYEPLMYFNYQEVNGGEDLETAFQTLDSLAQCEYSKAHKYMDKIHNSWNLLNRNSKISSQCRRLWTNCFNLDFLKKSCKLFPIQLFKLTRLRGQAAEEILKRFPSSKIIYLVRDPRAVYSSRMKVAWCPENTPCSNIDLLCNDLEEDLAEIRKLQAQNVKNVLLVKYEHIALNPLKNFKHIYKSLGIDWHDNVQKYLDAHTQNNTEDPMSTVKESAKHIDQWTYNLASATVQKVQKACREFMDDLQYTFMP